MKPQRFEIGQAITPNVKEWCLLEGSFNFMEPKFGVVYHVHSYSKFTSDLWFIKLKELYAVDTNYAEIGFDPVVDDSVLEKDLQSISEPVTV